jgi:hypothetical protein
MQRTAFLVCFLWARLFSRAAVAGIIMPTKPTIIELDKLGDILRRVEARELREEDYKAIVEVQAERAEPVFEELIRQAAQGDIVHNDDTGVKILEMMGERARQAALADEDAQASQGDSAKRSEAERTGMFTQDE